MASPQCGIVSLRRLAGVVALGVAPSLAGAQTAPPSRVTLGAAVRLAQERHPLVIEALGRLDVEGANKREAIGSWLPSVSASSGMSRSSSTRYNAATGQNVTASSPFSYSLGLSGSLTLFDGLERLYENRSANANTAKAEAGLIGQRFKVTLETKQAFYDVFHAMELERLAEGQVERAEQQLELSRGRVFAGTVIPSDTLRATVDRGRASLSLLEARAQRATSEAALGRLIGFDGGVEIVVDSLVLAMPRPDTAAIRVEAIAHAPAVAEADASLRASQAAAGVARAGLFPRISAGFSTARSGTEVSALNPSWSLGFSLSWSLFDRFARESGLARAGAEVRTAAAVAEDIRRQVGVQVTQQFAALATAEAQLEIALSSRNAAQEDLRVQQERYRQGVGTIVEILTAQQGVDQTEVAAVDARRAFQIARANLEAILGREL